MNIVPYSVEIGDSGGQKVYLLDGQKPHRIRLFVGSEYHFNIDAESHPFFLTLSPFGGPGSEALKGTQEPVDKGVFKFAPLSSHVGLDIYYQCSMHTKMGYKIQVLEI